MVTPQALVRPPRDVPVCLAGAVVVVVTARVVVVVVAVTAVVLALVVAVCLAGAVVVLAMHASAGRCRHHHTEANESKRDVLSQHRPRTQKHSHENLMPQAAKAHTAYAPHLLQNDTRLNKRTTHRE